MELMKFMVDCGSVIFVWMIVSQLIAWMISGPDEERVLTMWVCVFLAPILAAMVAAAFVQQRLVIWMARAGLPIEASDNPMDYL